MKKLILFISFLFCTIANAQGDKKDLYIKKHLPLLEQNLNTEEYNTFKKSMKFNKKGKLIAQDFNLLEKGSGDQFGVYYQYLITEETGYSGTIIFVNNDGKEMKIEPDGTITFDNTKEETKASTINSQIEGNFILSYANEKFNVNDLTAQNGLFIVTSTGCGPCVKAYQELNELTKNEAFSKINFVALYRDSFEKLNNYKVGLTYKKFGELEKPWNIFSSDELIKKYNSKYDFKGFPYVFIKKDGKIIYQKYGINLDKIKEELVKL